MRSALRRVLVSLVLVTTAAPFGLAQSNRPAGRANSSTSASAAVRHDLDGVLAW